jgi:hypothetical protein
MLALVAAAGLACSHALADNPPPPTDTIPTNPPPATTVTQPTPAPPPNPDPAPAPKKPPAAKKKPAPKPVQPVKPAATSTPTVPAPTHVAPLPAPVRPTVVVPKPKKRASPPARAKHKVAPRPAKKATPPRVRPKATIPKQAPAPAPAPASHPSQGLNWGLIAIAVAIAACVALAAVATWRTLSGEREEVATVRVESDVPVATSAVVATASSALLPELRSPPPLPATPVPMESNGSPASNGWDTCEIVWWRGYWKSDFYAQAVAPDGFAYDVARSRPFSWRSDEEPPRTGAIASAYSLLVEKLVADGWEEIGNGGSWYARRYRRSPDRSARYVTADADAAWD